MEKISVIIPCYNSEKTILNVINEIINTMEEHNHNTYEIIAVNDSSPDNVLGQLRTIASNNKKVKVINLAKNFGQHSAIMSGLNIASGDIIVCLDDDGQTPANEMFALIDELNKGFDIVYANYQVKKHTFIRNIGTKLNNLMAEYLIGKPKNINMTSYFVTRKFVIDEVIKYQNAFPYIGGLLYRVTNNISKVFVTHRNREYGESGYKFGTLLSLWLNGFTAFSVKPLRLASIIGVVMAIIGFFYGMTVIYNRLTNPYTPMGYASIFSAVIFIGGMLMLMLGLIGEYIGRIYISLNNSPQYVIKETINVEEK